MFFWLWQQNDLFRKHGEKTQSKPIPRWKSLEAFNVHLQCQGELVWNVFFHTFWTWHSKSSLGWINQLVSVKCWSPTKEWDENSTSQTSSEPNGHHFFVHHLNSTPSQSQILFYATWKCLQPPTPNLEAQQTQTFSTIETRTLLFAASKQVSPARPLLRNNGSCQVVDGAQGRLPFPCQRAWSNIPKLNPIKPQNTWPIGDERWNKFEGGWGTKMKYLKTFKETFFGDVFESKPQNKLGLKASPLLGGRVQGLANQLRPSLPGDKKNSETLCGESSELVDRHPYPPVPYKRCWNYSDMVVLAWLYRSQGYPRNTHNLQMLRSIFIIGQQCKDFGQKSL